MVSVVCPGCGSALHESVDLPPENRLACTGCGSKERTLLVSVEEHVEIRDHVAGLKSEEGRNVGFFETERQGRTSSADQSEEGSMSYVLSGSSPQGEEDTLTACCLLISVLNRQGGGWTEPKPGHGDADCVASDEGAPKRSLQIQVVRAVVDGDFWKRLAVNGQIVDTEATSQLVSRLRRAIELKVKPGKIPVKGRQQLLLALDATRLPVVTLDAVLEEFQAKHSAWVQSLGFREVWVVGPVEELVRRLGQWNEST